MSYFTKTKITDESKNQAQVTRYGQLETAEAVRLSGGVFNGNLLDTNINTSVVSNGGSVVVANSELSLSITTTANSYSGLYANQIARFTGCATNNYNGVHKVAISGLTNNTQRWGFCNILPMTQGAYFKYENGVLYCASMINGVEWAFASGDFNGDGTETNKAYTLDGNYHYFDIKIANARLTFFIDGEPLHVASLEQDVKIGTLQLRPFLDTYNTGKNGNVVYTPRPIDQNTGKEAHAQIEWIPFAQSNKDIDFKNLFEQTNKRIDMAYGVSQFIKGVDDAPNYATAEVSEAGFAKRAVKPLALRIYTTITHELNRITNGLGVAITFKYEIPAIADAEKVKAETRTLDANIVNTLITAGWSLNSIVDALQLPQSYKLLKKEEVTAVIENDKPDVDDGGEVNNSPDPSKIDTFSNSIHQHNGGCSCTNPKATTDDTYQKRIKSVARKFMQSQIDKAIADVEKENNPTNEVSGDYTNDDLETFTTEALLVITSLLIDKGSIQYEEGIQIVLNAGLNADMLTGFALTQDKLDAYKAYLTNVGKSYASDTQTAIQSVLSKAKIEELTYKDIQKNLKNLTSLEEWRVTRLARTETARAGGEASLYAMEDIQAETGYIVKKIWNTSGVDPCEFCRTMASTDAISVSSAFVQVGGRINGVDGGILTNDFVDMNTANAHPNCNCYLTWEVE